MSAPRTSGGRRAQAEAPGSPGRRPDHREALEGTRRLTGRQRAVLAVLLTASFTLAVDFSILNVALPMIGADVGLRLEHWQWIGTTYALCAAGFTLAFGRLADLVGRRRMFLVGMVLLGLSSAAGAVATGPALLLLARVGQGLATAMVIPAGLALLTTEFAEGAARQRVLGLNGALMAGGFTTGAVFGGFLTGFLDWRWAFLLNVAVAVVVLVVAPRVLVESKVSQRTRIDFLGATIVTLALVALVYSVTAAGEGSWNDPQVLGLGCAGIVLMALFVRVETRVADPLVSLSTLRRPTVGSANVAGLLAFATETSLVFLLTVHMQQVLGWSPVATGAAFGLLGAGTMLGGVLGPRVIAAVGTRAALSGAMLLQASMTAPLALMGASGAWVALMLAASFVGGVANLVAIVAFMVQATAAVGREEQGLATGLATLSQQVGIAIGTPVMSAVVAASLSGSRATDSVSTALSIAIGCNAALCLATAAWVLLTQKAVPRTRHADEDTSVPHEA